MAGAWLRPLFSWRVRGHAAGNPLRGAAWILLGLSMLSLGRGITAEGVAETNSLARGGEQGTAGARRAGEGRGPSASHGARPESAQGAKLACGCGAAPDPCLQADRLRDGGRIDLNEADADALALVPGIGPRLAQRILEDRRARGRFRALADLQRVSGIGPRLAARFAAFLCTTDDGVQGDPSLE